MHRISKIILALLALASAQAHAVPESVLGTIHELLNTVGDLYTVNSFEGVRRKKVGFLKFGQKAGSKGCMVISPGFAEAAIKYTELAYDFYKSGYSPIYIIDHRGQGFSDHLNIDAQKMDVERFRYFARDLSKLVNDFVLKDENCDAKNLFLVAHSMGSTIALNYLQNRGKHSPFKKAALNAPMLKIVFPEGKNEWDVFTQTWAACHLPFITPNCFDYAPGKGRYDPNRPFDQNPVTHSFTRFSFTRDIYERWPESQMGGPSIHWVYEATTAEFSIRQGHQMAKIKIPFLVLQAGADTYVENPVQEETCASSRFCQFLRIEGAKHEVFMESDSMRDQALAKILEFFDSPK